ncbi:hypothetical protein HDV00_009310 [Rhizophlyctis rosea]|nr:hypothetical protein HDV00_009310 [Rhizophlyctis rosea]
MSLTSNHLKPYSLPNQTKWADHEDSECRAEGLSSDLAAQCLCYYSAKEYKCYSKCLDSTDPWVQGGVAAYSSKTKAFCTDKNIDPAKLHPKDWKKPKGGVAEQY